MQRQFIDDLVGKPLGEAQRLIREAGFEPYEVPHGWAITLELKPGKVIIWHEDDVVTSAMAGDHDEWED